MGCVACVVEVAFGEHAPVPQVFQDAEGGHVEDGEEEGQEHFLPEDGEGEEVLHVDHHEDGGEEGEEGEALLFWGWVGGEKWVRRNECEWLRVHVAYTREREIHPKRLLTIYRSRCAKTAAKATAAVKVTTAMNRLRPHAREKNLAPLPLATGGTTIGVGANVTDFDLVIVSSSPPPATGACAWDCPSSISTISSSSGGCRSSSSS